MTEKSVKKSKKHRKSEVSEGDAQQPASKTKTKRDRNNEDELDTATTSAKGGENGHETAVDMPGKADVSKKRKRTKGDETLDESAASGVDAAQRESKKSKKRKEGGDTKHPSPYPDPNNDESLTDQSRKALSYAYERFQIPETWKFNKARQNWLLRNIWSENAIPENYIPVVIKYFADLKGGSREKLIETCRKVSAADSERSQTADDATQPVSGSAMVNQPNRSRAQSLLQSLQAS